MEWEIVIGIETHVQLSTESKIFSGASTDFGAMPNAHACEVDLALPGVLPVLNKDAVEKALRFGVATQANINQRSIFARKAIKLVRWKYPSWKVAPLNFISTNLKRQLI